MKKAGIRPNLHYLGEKNGSHSATLYSATGGDPGPPQSSSHLGILQSLPRPPFPRPLSRCTLPSQQIWASIPLKNITMRMRMATRRFGAFLSPTPISRRPNWPTTLFLMKLPTIQPWKIRNCSCVVAPQLTPLQSSTTSVNPWAQMDEVLSLVMDCFLRALPAGEK